jgi:hypothetical protein
MIFGNFRVDQHSDLLTVTSDSILSIQKYSQIRTRYIGVEIFFKHVSTV